MDNILEPLEYNIIVKGAQIEIVEKKSRFIAISRFVSSQEEATEFVDEMKKKYWDAKHHCFAFVIGKNKEVTRCSDDGEPSGTAGRPMLEVILGEEITNIAVVVTRYFGGTLLGTGGLVRAYSKATKEVITNSQLAIMKMGTLLLIKTDYQGIGKVLSIIEQNEILMKHSKYECNVEFTVWSPILKCATLKAELVNATAGKVDIEELEHCYEEVTNLWM